MVAAVVVSLTATSAGAVSPAAAPANLFGKDVRLCVVNQKATAVSIGVENGLAIDTSSVAPGARVCAASDAPQMVVTYRNGQRISIGGRNLDLGAPYVQFLEGVVGTPITVFPSEGTAEQVTMYGRSFRVERKNDTDYKEFVVDLQGAGGPPSSATLCVSSTVPEKGLLQWERPSPKDVPLEASKASFYCATGARDTQAVDVAGRVSYPSPGRDQVWQVSMDADTAAAFRVGVSAGAACSFQLELGLDEVEAVTCGPTRVIVARGLGADQRPRVKLTFENA